MRCSPVGIASMLTRWAIPRSYGASQVCMAIRKRGSSPSSTTENATSSVRNSPIDPSPYDLNTWVRYAYSASTSAPATVNGKSKAQSSPFGSVKVHLRFTSGTVMSAAFLAGYTVERNTVTMTMRVEEIADSEE